LSASTYLRAEDIEPKSYKSDNNLPFKRRVKRELVNGFG